MSIEKIEFPAHPCRTIKRLHREHTESPSNKVLEALAKAVTARMIEEMYTDIGGG